jgi:hypothetical protein
VFFDFMLTGNRNKIDLEEEREAHNGEELATKYNMGFAKIW